MRAATRQLPPSTCESRLLGVEPYESNVPKWPRPEADYESDFSQTCVSDCAARSGRKCRGALRAALKRTIRAER